MDSEVEGPEDTKQFDGQCLGSANLTMALKPDTLNTFMVEWCWHFSITHTIRGRSKISYLSPPNSSE